MQMTQPIYSTPPSTPYIRHSADEAAHAEHLKTTYGLPAVFQDDDDDEEEDEQ